MLYAESTAPALPLIFSADFPCVAGHAQKPANHIYTHSQHTRGLSAVQTRVYGT